MIILNEKQREQLAIVRQKEIRKGVKDQGTMQLRKGMIVWEYNSLTGEIHSADIEMVSKLVNGKIVCQRKLRLKDESLFVTAVNRKNAERKIKMILQNLLK